MSQKEKRKISVAALLGIGYTEKEMAAILGKSTRTVVRDVAELKKEAEDWFEKMPKNGYTYEVKFFSDFLKWLSKDMFEMYTNSQDTKEKLKILKGLGGVVSSRFILIHRGPVLYRIRNLAKFGLGVNLNDDDDSENEENNTNQDLT